MCGVISIDKYRQKRQNEIVAEYTKDGQDALLVQDFAGDVAAILSDDGTKFRLFWSNDRRHHFRTTQQLEAGHQFFTDNGYILKTASETRKVAGETIQAITVDEATDFAESLSTEEAVAVQLLLNEAVPSLA